MPTAPEPLVQPEFPLATDPEPRENKEVAALREELERLRATDKETAQLREELQQLRAAAKQSEDQREEIERLRCSEAQLAADFRNYRRHAEADLAQTTARARVELLAELADTVAALESASSTVDDDPVAVREGVALVARSLQKVFDANGLQRVETEGVLFDPTIHEAVLVEQVEGVEKGTVVRELSPGFRTDDEVIRPAKVSVAA